MQNLTPTVIQTNVGDSGQKQSTFEVPTVAQPTFAAVKVAATDLLIRKFKKIEGDIQDQVDYCPIRLTGTSPSLFVYAPKGTAVTVEPGVKLTYSDPYLRGGDSWTARSLSGGALDVAGAKRDYLYYEYAGASFARPEKGWVVKKSDLSSLANTVLAGGLGLNSKETERAVFELNHAAASIDAGTVFVGIVDGSEVAAKAPLTVNPKPQAAYRIHFYVGHVAGSKVSAPELTPIVRQPFTVVELGSYSGK